MKYDLNAIRADVDNFMVHDHVFHGETVYLIQPCHIGTAWQRDTLNRRSVVVNGDGEIVSASYKKFFNWDEKPDLDPIPASLADAQLMAKIDGSTLIFSRYKGHTMARTRGTVDASLQPLNGHEIDVLLEKYPAFRDWLKNPMALGCSYLFEWTSPLNKIVIDYGAEPDMYLTGVIRHGNYAYLQQSNLDDFAKDLGLRRPKYFSYNSITEMKSAVEVLKDEEGLCVYYNNGQSTRKVKAAEYLARHRMKSELRNIEKVVDVWFVAGRLPYQDFFNYCEKSFDYEIANDARGFMSNICDAWKEVEQVVEGFHVFVNKVKHMSRKDAAIAILQAYGKTNRASFVFSILDSKPLNEDNLKKLLYQKLKN